MSKKKKVAKNLKDSSFNLDPAAGEDAVKETNKVTEETIETVADTGKLSEEPEKKKKRKGFLWIILILLLCVGAYFGYDYWNKNKPLKPTTTLNSTEVTITAGDNFKPEDNLVVGEGDTYQITTDLNTTKEGTYTVNVKIFSSSGIEDNKSFTVKVNAPKSEKGCELVYVVDTPETTEKKWIIDKPGKPAVTKQKYVKDKDEVKEVSHYEDVWVDDKGHYEKVLIKEAVPEQGHYETIVITPAVEEVGHWETVTVPEQGHYEEAEGC